MGRSRLGLLASLLALSACASLSVEGRVRQKLLDAGVKPRMAQCLAERLSDRLTTRQLEALGRAADLPGKHLGHMSFDALLRRVEAVDDPETVSVVARAGIACAISR